MAITTTTTAPSTRLRLDGKRRATLSPALLEAAGLDPGTDLVARVDGPGRIVLESPDTMLARLRQEIRRGKAERDAARGDGEQVPDSLADDLLADRRRDESARDHPTSGQAQQDR